MRRGINSRSRWRQTRDYLNELEARAGINQGDINILEKWPTVKTSVEENESLLIPEGHQLLVFREFTLDGGEVFLDGELIIIGGDVRGGGPSPNIEKAVNYTITLADHTVIATVDGLTFTLPTAVGLEGKEYILKLDVLGTLTIATDGSETIDDGATAVLTTQYESITVISNGTNWDIV